MNQTILNQDILSRQHEIPSVIFGIGDPEKGMIRRKTLTSLNEEYDAEQSRRNAHIINHAIKGQDYEDDLLRLHRNVEPFVPEGHAHNAEDNYIFDTLKKGKPNAHAMMHVLDVMNHDVSTYGFSDRTSNRRYLKQKWEPFFKEHLQQPLKHTDVNESNIALSELKEIPLNLTPVNYRAFEHPSKHIFEHQPGKGLQYIGTNPVAMRALDSRSRDDRAYLNQEADLSKHYGQYPNPNIEEYTRHSSTLNDYIVKPSTAAENTPEREHANKLTKRANEISAHLNAIPHQTHANSFTVYTGMHDELNPETALPVNEHGEKIIHSPGFTSTSLSLPTAESFARAKPHAELGRRVHDVLKLEIPGGYPHGAYVAPQSVHEHEKEYLLDRGHTFVVHPEPTYHMGNNEIYRLWDARIHPRDYESSSTPWHALLTSSKIGIALNPATKTETISKAANDMHPAVRAAAAKHPEISVADYKTLLKDDSPSVRQAAASSTKLPHYMMDRIADSGHTALMKGLANRQTLPEDIKRKLIGADVPEVSREMAKRTDLSDEHMDELSTRDPETLTALAGNPNVKENHIASILSRDIKPATVAIARNAATPKPILEHLMNHDNAVVRHEATHNPRRFRLGKV